MRPTVFMAGKGVQTLTFRCLSDFLTGFHARLLPQTGSSTDTDNAKKVT